MTDRKKDRHGLIEYRHQNGFKFRAKKDDDEIRVTGQAAVYDSDTMIWWYRERIDPGAFTRSIDEGVDVEFLISHGGLPLARTSSGTLELDNRENGLYIDANLSRGDPDVERIVPKMERGDLSKMSIGFYVLDEKWSLPDKDGVRTRTVIEAELFDVSIVSNPAYDETSIAVAKRSLEKHEAAERLAARVPEKERERRFNLFQKYVEVMTCQLK